MNKALQTIHERFISLMQLQAGVWGAWYFGSIARGRSDEHSDMDVVFLLNGALFSNAAAQLTTWLQSCCDRVLFCRPEGFNGDAIVNNGYLLELDGEIVVYDVFLLNSCQLDDGICRIHYAELRKENVIFDIDGHVKELMFDSAEGTPWRDDVLRLINDYWYHAHLSAKYLLRGDFFKLERVTRALMDAHASLLLTTHDRLTWGGSADKLRFLPAEKQRHLRLYGCTDDFLLVRANLLTSFRWFDADAKAILPPEIPVASEDVIAYWISQTQILSD